MKILRIYSIAIIALFAINMTQTIFAAPIHNNDKAQSELTTVEPGIKLYSEYYPNPTAKFKGTIVFINGSGTSMGEWGQNKKFFHCAKKAGSLFFYDRSGLGKSPANFNYSEKNFITGKLISNQLLILLKKRRVPAPYLIVAHSYGSIYAGYFALKNPKLVKGILFVDPVPRDFQFSDKLMKPYKKGIGEAIKNPASAIYKKYNGSEVEAFYQMLGFTESKKQLKELGDISNSIPVIIISSTGMEYKVKPIKEDWFTAQKQWLNKNPHSKILQVKSGHFIQIDRPNIVCRQLVNDL